MSAERWKSASSQVVTVLPVSSEMIFNDVRIADKVLIPKEQLMEHLRGRDLDCLVTFGAGDVDRFIEPIETWLKSRL